jgi:putative colanic acid biosynthesis glycosyltransferase
MNNVKIAQVNVRLTEGGAAQVALGLHNGLIRTGADSTFLYGYSKRALPSVAPDLPANSQNLALRSEVVWNYLQHSLVGRDLNLPILQNHQRQLAQMVPFDIIHLHAIHSYFLNYGKILEGLLARSKRIVWTLHDYWILTGRCAFTDGCLEWQRGCGRCPTLSNYPSSRFDFSSVELPQRRAFVRSIAKICTFVSPSKHLAKDFASIYPECKLKIIPNSINSEFEAAFNESDCGVLSGLGLEDNPEPGRLRVLVVAHDLAYRGKTNHEFIRQIQQLPSIQLITVGKNSPFSGINCINLGEIRSRQKMADIYRSADALLFTSVVDNFPLTICEALCAGLPVLATPSPAADEVLSYVKGIAFSEEDVYKQIEAGAVFANYSEISNRNQLAVAARASFSSEAMLAAYLDVYKSD